MIIGAFPLHPPFTQSDSELCNSVSVGLHKLNRLFWFTIILLQFCWYVSHSLHYRDFNNKLVMHIQEYTVVSFRDHISVRKSRNSERLENEILYLNVFQLN